MKKYKWWLIGGAILLVGGLTTFFVIRSRNRGGSTGSNKSKLKNPNPKKILLIGDSVTTIKNYANNKPITSTYGALTKKDLEQEGYVVDVLAKGGEATRWMLSNLPEQLKGKKYDRIYIYGGINDAWNNSIKPSEPFENIQKMVDLGNENGADVFVVLGYRIDNFMDYKKMATTRYVPTQEGLIPLIQEYQAFQKELPNKINNASFLPVFDLNGQTNDGIHPSGKAPRQIADIFIKSIKG